MEAKNSTADRELRISKVTECADRIGLGSMDGSGTHQKLVGPGRIHQHDFQNGFPGEWRSGIGDART